MRRLGLAALMLAAVAAATVVASPALAQKKGRAAKPTALIPFEAERAKERGDRHLIRLNDDVTRLPASRVVELPVVDGRLGEHARLDDVELFFPFGSVVLATAEFHRYRPAQLASGSSETPAYSSDPKYDRTRAFDAQLGKVCASDKQDDGRRVEMRISPERILSLVHVMPAVHAGPTAKDHPSYRVVSGLEMRFLSFKEPEAERLYRLCQRPGGTTVSAKD